MTPSEIYKFFNEVYYSLSYTQMREYGLYPEFDFYFDDDDTLDIYHEKMSDKCFLYSIENANYHYYWSSEPMPESILKRLQLLKTKILLNS